MGQILKFSKKEKKIEKGGNKFEIDGMKKTHPITYSMSQLFPRL
jgi:hypothetical protein